MEELQLEDSQQDTDMFILDMFILSTSREPRPILVKIAYTDINLSRHN